MFTETELRDALQHSAARADDLHLGPPVTAAPAAPGPRRRWALPVIAAATVAAFAFGVVSIVGAPDDGRDAAAPSPSSTVHLVDLAVAGTSSVETSYSFTDVGERTRGGQTISRDLGSEKETVRLTVLPADFTTPTEVERGRRVSIAGTDGWFALRKTYLLDGETGGKDKPLPFWTVAFRTPDGDWAFARIDTLHPSSRHDGSYDEVSVKDSARIVAAYDGLDIDWVRDGARQPLQLGRLPDDARLVGATYSVVKDRVVDEELEFALRGTWFRVQYGPPGRALFGSCPIAPDAKPRPCPGASRKVAGGTLKLVFERDGLLDAAAVLRKVTVASEPAGYVGFEEAVSR